MKLAVLLLVAACGTDDPGGTTIDSTPLDGVVGGQTWIIASGDTDAFLSTDGDFFAVMYATPFTACGSKPIGDHLIVSVPKAIGQYPFSLQRNMTYYVGNRNLIATSGTVVVSEVTATTVRGRLRSEYDADNSVNGAFELTICAQ